MIVRHAAQIGNSKDTARSMIARTVTAFGQILPSLNENRFNEPHSALGTHHKLLECMRSFAAVIAMRNGDARVLLHPGPSI